MAWLQLLRLALAPARWLLELLAYPAWAPEVRLGVALAVRVEAPAAEDASEMEGQRAQLELAPLLSSLELVLEALVVELSRLELALEALELSIPREERLTRTRRMTC